MRSLAEIVKANREAEQLGIKTSFNPIGVVDERPVTNPEWTATLSPERMQKLGLDKY
jgi:hypothetical protein